MHDTISNTASLSRDLLAKARLLKESALFVNPSEGAELHDKQLIFLVLAGLKPVAEVASSHWVEVPGGRKTAPDDPAEVGAFLGSLGLHYHLSQFEGHATAAVVALTPELADEYLGASGYLAVGRLLGYPDTAVRAFEREFGAGQAALLPASEEQQIVGRQVGLNQVTTAFRFSREHWQDELEIARSWSDVLTKAGLADN